MKGRRLQHRSSFSRVAGDVLMCLFYFENVVMRENDWSKLVPGLRAYLKGAAIKYFFEKFTGNGTTSDAGKDFDAVTKSFFEKFPRQEEPQGTIRESADGVLSHENLLSSVSCLDHVYSRAGYNDEAKYGFSRVPVMKIPLLATFAVSCPVSTYDESKRAIKDFDSGTRAFRSSEVEGRSNAVEWKKKQDVKAVRLLARPGARVQIVKSKVDTLAKPLSSLRLLMEIGQSASARVRSLDRNPGQPSGVVYEKAYSYREKLRHGANRCSDSPNRGKRFLNCEKAGHGAEKCWSRKNPSDFSGKADQDMSGSLPEHIDSSSLEEESD